MSSDVEDVWGEGFGEGLGVGVDGPEGDAVDAGLDHAVDGVASSASDSEDLVLGVSLGWVWRVWLCVWILWWGLVVVGFVALMMSGCDVET